MPINALPLSTSTAPVSRRQLLQGAVALGVAGLSKPVLSQSSVTSLNSTFANSFTRFSGPISKVQGTGFNGMLETAEVEVEGRLPPDLVGTLYRNGPARFRFGTTQYNHWFDGDGMVQSFKFGGGKVRHLGVLLRTPKLTEEEAAGRFLYPAFGTEVPNSNAVRSADVLNVANINVMTLKDGAELYALWEGGSALQLDASTLEAKDFKVWSPETKGAPFSAHPRRGADGTLWNFGYSAGSGKLVIYEIDSGGTLKRQALLAAPQADMVHDFAITENYLVFLLMPLALKQGAMPTGSLDRYDWHANAPLIAMVVSKADFSIQRVELENGGLFHLGNAWEEKGIIRLAYARYTQFLGHLKGLTLPNPRVSSNQLAYWTEVEINLKNASAKQIDTGLHGVEFPRFDSRLTGERTDLTVLMQNTHVDQDDSYGSDTVLAVRREKIQRFVYGPEWLAEEHIYVPQTRTPQRPGWIMGTALNRRNGKTTLSVFDAHDLSSGPVAQLRLPYGLPLGLHGQFVPA